MLGVMGLGDNGVAPRSMPWLKGDIDSEPPLFVYG
jgi:hypothetical protein